jgi:hypothetical protein
MGGKLAARSGHVKKSETLGLCTNLPNAFTQPPMR